MVKKNNYRKKNKNENYRTTIHITIAMYYTTVIFK